MSRYSRRRALMSAGAAVALAPYARPSLTSLGSAAALELSGPPGSTATITIVTATPTDVPTPTLTQTPDPDSACSPDKLEAVIKFPAGRSRDAIAIATQVVASLGGSATQVLGGSETLTISILVAGDPASELPTYRAALLSYNNGYSFNLADIYRERVGGAGPCA